ncbi:MAG TPA: YceI family protein [Gemmatimonadales bacterium]|nr:YceI family protein [Gemmatimonadales bacterium]
MTQATMAPDTTTGWQIDPAHSGIDFSVRHLMISTVRGRFGSIAGRVGSIDANGGAPRVEVTIDPSTITTSNDQRDKHLRSADFFDVERYPTMTFTASEVEGDLDQTFTLTGDLTIRDVTKPISFEVEAHGVTVDPWGNRRAGYSARGKLSRSAYGLTWNQMLEAGGVTVGDEVKFTIDVALTQPMA